MHTHSKVLNAVNSKPIHKKLCFINSFAAHASSLPNASIFTASAAVHPLNTEHKIFSYTMEIQLFFIDM